MKPRLLILGSGFASFSILKELDDRYFDITVVSERNHFLFTPLLPSSTVGTLEFRSIIEPIRSKKKRLTCIQASCTGVDTATKRIQAKTVAGDSFELPYDYLVIGVGAVNHTFGVPGVSEYAFFLKELRDARRIRQRIIDLFEQACTPGLTVEDQTRLLSFVVVGGGPTGVEFAAELADFLEKELTSHFPDLVGLVRISLVEASKQILGAFDTRVAEYATKLFNRRRVAVLTGKVVELVESKSIRLADGSSLDFGLLVWSTGNGPCNLVLSLPFEKDRAGRLVVDERFCLPDADGVFAVGDCAVIRSLPLPATAQVAMQGGKYLGRLFNEIIRSKVQPGQRPPFRYKHLGMLAYIGDHRAVADLPGSKSAGFTTWLFWRSVYLTRLVSLKNKAMVLFDWSKALLFGRDISRF